MKNSDLPKKTLILLDILMIIGILSHIGAYIITNALVVKDKPEAKFVEVNPAANIVYDFQAAPEPERSNMILKMLGKIGHFILMGVALGVYIWMRNRAYHWRDYLVLCICVGIWFTIHIFDFSNNLGFLIGRLML